MKNIRIFHLKIFIFLVVKFSVYLNRHVFVMGKLNRVPYVTSEKKCFIRQGEFKTKYISLILLDNIYR